MNIPVTIYHWIAFIVAIVSLLTIDLWFASKNPHRIKIKEALLTSAGWISLALFFNLWIFFQYGKDPALAFLTGYLLEEALSIDNLFVFLIIFSHFAVPSHIKHKVLFWGILGAVIMRALLILGGIYLVHTFSWMFYIFGAFLIYSGYKLAFKADEETVIEEKWIYKFLSSRFPMTPGYHNGEFFIKKAGKWLMTPLFVVLILIETTDLIFALDSVPAILGITTDPFIVFTSNIFAILGLRSLFFVLEEGMSYVYLLHYALAAILVFIGIKMIIGHFIQIPVILTLGIIVFFILIAVVGSFIYPKKEEKS